MYNFISLYSAMLSSVVFLLFLFFSMMFYTLTPLSLAFNFFFFVLWGTVSGYLFVSDFFPYMLYLVYIGGLLVLLIYMIIISTNSMLPTLSFLLMLSICISSLVLTSVTYFYTSYPPMLMSDKMFLSGGSLRFNDNALVLLVVFLLYVFLYVCESIRLGGRSLKMSKL